MGKKKLIRECVTVIELASILKYFKVSVCGTATQCLHATFGVQKPKLVELKALRTNRREYLEGSHHGKGGGGNL